LERRSVFSEIVISTVTLDWPMAVAYTCRICGLVHDGLPLSWGPDAPDMWAEMSPDERSQRGEAGTDQTVIDDRHFFIRGRIEDPITETGETFAWLVWVEVSATDFFEMSELWTVEGRETKAEPCDGRLANSLRIYEEPTLGLSVKVHTRPVGDRPFVEIMGEHQLRDEQIRGITLHRVKEIHRGLMS
jgi:hypothetical protein